MYLLENGTTNHTRRAFSISCVRSNGVLNFGCQLLCCFSGWRGIMLTCSGWQQPREDKPTQHWGFEWFGPWSLLITGCTPLSQETPWHEVLDGVPNVNSSKGMTCHRQCPRPAKPQFAALAQQGEFGIKETVGLGCFSVGVSTCTH